MTPKLKPLKPYEPNWPHGYCTRGGFAARYLGTIRQPGATLVFAVEGEATNTEWLTTFMPDGSWRGASTDRRDIMCAAPQRPDHRYVFIVEDTAGRLSAPWPSRQRAMQHIDECDERFPELSPRKVLRFVQDQEDAA